MVFIIAATSAQVTHAQNADDRIIPAVDCVINPYRVVDVSSPAAGVIEKLFVERSQRIRAGQEIARLESSVERANVDLARYRASVESEIELGMVNINFDRMRKQRVERLLEASNVSRESADQVEREVQLSEWKLKQARELADIRKLELHRAQAQLRQKSVTSPFDGFVLDIYKYRGEYVEDQAIARLAQLDPLVIEAIVPMENFGQIEPGMHADVVPEILLKDKIRGEVIAVDRIGDTASNTFGVKLSVPNPENRIPAGLKCVARFIETTPAQISAEVTIPVTQESAVSQPVEATPAGIAEKESSGLLSSLIGNANAATLPSAQAGETDNPLFGKVTRNLSEESVNTGDKLTKSNAKTPTSYMVMIKTPDSKAKTWDLVAKLRAAGENDFLVYSKTGRISFGVYESLAAANKRHLEIETLGFRVHTLERFQ